MLGEAGQLPPGEVASRAAEALHHFTDSPSLLQHMISAARLHANGQQQDGVLGLHLQQLAPSHTHDATGYAFACPPGMAAASNLCAAFLSLSAWMGRGAAAAAMVGRQPAGACVWTCMIEFYLQCTHGYICVLGGGLFVCLG